MTSILTSSKNDPCVFCSTLHGLSNAVYRFSMRCVVLEISGGGGAEITPPPVLGWLRPPPVRGLMFIQGSLTGSVGTWQRLCPLIRRTRVKFPVPSDLRAGTSIWDNQVRCQLSHTCCTPAKEQEPSVEWGNESPSEVRGIKNKQYILVLDFTLPTSIKRIP